MDSKELLKSLTSKDIDDSIEATKTGEKSPTEILSEHFFIVGASAMFSIDEEERLKAFNNAEKIADNRSVIKRLFEMSIPSLYALIDMNLNEQQRKIVYCCLENALRSKSISTLTSTVVLLEQVVKPLITTINNLIMLTGKKEGTT